MTLTDLTDPTLAAAAAGLALRSAQAHLPSRSGRELAAIEADVALGRGVDGTGRRHARPRGRRVA